MCFYFSSLWCLRKWLFKLYPYSCSEYLYINLQTYTPVQGINFNFEHKILKLTTNDFTIIAISLVCVYLSMKNSYQYGLLCKETYIVSFRSSYRSIGNNIPVWYSHFPSLFSLHIAIKRFSSHDLYGYAAILHRSRTSVDINLLNTSLSLSKAPKYQTWTWLRRNRHSLVFVATLAL